MMVINLVVEKGRDESIYMRMLSPSMSAWHEVLLRFQPEKATFACWQ